MFEEGDTQMGSPDRAEPDVAADPQQVTSDTDDPQVGRVGPDEADAVGETGAERRGEKAGREGEERVRSVPPAPGAPMQHGENR